MCESACGAVSGSVLKDAAEDSFVSGPYDGAETDGLFVSPTSPNKFQKVVLVPFRGGSWTLGFVTADDTPEVSFRVGEPIFNVFVPTTPNPTSGS